IEVGLRSACPSSVCRVGRSAPPSNRCVAKLCRSKCGRTALVMPARCAASRQRCLLGEAERGKRRCTAGQIKENTRLPTILTQEEAVRLIDSASNLFHPTGVTRL